MFIFQVGFIIAHPPPSLSASTSTRETRTSPKYRDNEFVKTASAYAARIKGPFLGHKFVPHPAGWPGFDFLRMITPELMHGKFVRAYVYVPPHV